MDAMFTITYGEYIAADKLVSKIKNTSIFVPASRQEKGIDLILYKDDNGINKNCTIQVKQSRTYNKSKEITSDEKTIHTTGDLWFNTFKVPDNAEWFLFVGTRFIIPEKYKDAGIFDVESKPIILAFTNEEMKKFMSEVRKKTKPDEADNSFGFSYNNSGHIYQTRGFASNRNMDKYLLEKRIKDIEQFLNNK